MPLLSSGLLAIFLAISCQGVASVRENWYLASALARSFLQKYQSIPKVSRVMGIFAVTFWPRQFLGQRKVSFGNSFVWILSTLMCIQNFIKISHMVDDLLQFPDTHIFFGVALVKER